jgi:hypothetical protein
MEVCDYEFMKLAIPCRGGAPPQQGSARRRNCTRTFAEPFSDQRKKGQSTRLKVMLTICEE